MKDSTEITDGEITVASTNLIKNTELLEKKNSIQDSTLKFLTLKLL